MNILTMRCARQGCANIVRQSVGLVNRALRNGQPLYCGRRCAGIARQQVRTVEEQKEIKRLYDAARRTRLRERLKAQRAAYFQRTYNPAEAAVKRHERMPYHVEYCRQPQYKKKKAGYDRKRRAAEYGDFAEAYLLLLGVDREVNSRSSDYEIRLQNGTLNKTTRRRRDYTASVGGEFKDGPLANPLRDQR